MERSLFYPSIDDIVFRVALEYENLDRGSSSRLNGANYSLTKRENIIVKTGIGYSERAEDDVVLYVKLAPYIINVGREYYLFEGVKIGRNFKLQDKFIAFTGPPKVLRNEYYHHPFVFRDSRNKICFGGDGREDGRWSREDLDIYWNIWYDTTDTTKKNVTFKIAKWLEEGRFVIQQGYFGNHTKVHELKRDEFPSEYRIYIEAVSSGIEIIEPISKN